MSLDHVAQQDAVSCGRTAGDGSLCVDVTNPSCGLLGAKVAGVVCRCNTICCGCGQMPAPMHTWKPCPKKPLSFRSCWTRKLQSMRFHGTRCLPTALSLNTPPPTPRSHGPLTQYSPPSPFPVPSHPCLLHALHHLRAGPRSSLSDTPRTCLVHCSLYAL